MFKYTFGVDGASPGLGGRIVVLAPTVESARRMARDELVEMNKRREAAGVGPVSLDEDNPTRASVQIPGVVYSCDGEA